MVYTCILIVLSSIMDDISTLLVTLLSTVHNMNKTFASDNLILDMDFSVNYKILEQKCSFSLKQFHFK
jgi:hypothetical protein